MNKDRQSKASLAKGTDTASIAASVNRAMPFKILEQTFSNRTLDLQCRYRTCILPGTDSFQSPHTTIQWYRDSMFTTQWLILVHAC